MVNLQLPTSGDSGKVEVGEIPPLHMPSLGAATMPTFVQRDEPPTSDTYLTSILSKSTSSPTNATQGTTCRRSSDCSCYKCSRQRRRVGTKTKSPPQRSQSLKSASPSICLRKTPSLKLYEKHDSRFTEQDSIYRIPVRQQKEQSNLGSNKTINESSDTYEISWKDESGDDLLSSLRTVQSIFEERPEDDPEGLSELLEERAKQLKMRQAMEKHLVESDTPKKPPRRDDCITLSYRDGPTHRPLTLYHTMKMKAAGERMNAYGRAFDHCMRAKSGLSDWLEKQASKEMPPVMTTYTPPYHKRPVKRSILPPLLSGRKNKIGLAEDLWTRTTTRITERTVSSSAISEETALNPPTDIIGTAKTLVSAEVNFASIRHDGTNYDSMDIPGRPLPRSGGGTDPSYASGKSGSQSKDNSSISSGSVDGEGNPKLARSTTRFFGSIGRRSARSRNTTPSLHSVDSNKISVSTAPPIRRSHTDTSVTSQGTSCNRDNSYEKILDNLCEIMPHVSRSVLAQYVHDAEGDYMKALLLCKHAVAAGKL
ncbi:hypothetical protein EC973_008336 [Apophysomyces ossiformis]|uniref:Uncharacterized protein n=1 Tax=Apophysomyces ossiformis TaxID=679940 RepID=A0A8H7BYV7_9FUNG|nr:hypothetical protein EC973_008336 [Apophysomyces ossiformis]